MASRRRTLSFDCPIRAIKTAVNGSACLFWLLELFISTAKRVFDECDQKRGALSPFYFPLSLFLCLSISGRSEICPLPFIIPLTDGQGVEGLENWPPNCRDCFLGARRWIRVCRRVQMMIVMTFYSVDLLPSGFSFDSAIPICPFPSFRVRVRFLPSPCLPAYYLFCLSCLFLSFKCLLRGRER